MKSRVSEFICLIFLSYFIKLKYQKKVNYHKYIRVFEYYFFLNKFYMFLLNLKSISFDLCKHVRLFYYNLFIEMSNINNRNFFNINIIFK